MEHPDWISREPENPTWNHDGTQLFFQRKRAGSEVRDWFQLSIGMPGNLSAPANNLSTSQRVPLNKLNTLLPLQGQWNDDRTLMIGTRGGDLFLFNKTAGEQLQLTRTTARESQARFMKNQNVIQFVRDDQLFLRDLTSGLEWEPFVLKFADPPKDSDPTAGRTPKSSDTDSKPATRGDADFLERQETQLFEFLAKQEEMETQSAEHRKAMDRVNQLDVDEPFYLGKNRQLVNQTLSADQRWLAVVTTAAGASRSGRRDKMPVWIREDAYVENRDVRSLVGDEQEPPQQLLMIDLKKRQIHTIALDSLPEISVDRLAFLKSSSSATGEKAASQTNNHRNDETEIVGGNQKSADNNKPRDVSISSVQFSADSRFLLFQCFSTDNKDRWIVTQRTSKAADKGSLKVLHHRYDPAWINWRERTAAWVGTTSSIYFTSEATGHQHLYIGNPQSGTALQLTEGSFEVSDPEIAPDAASIFFTCNMHHPGEYELAVVHLPTKTIRQLTNLGGVNSFTLNDNCDQAVALHSTALRPPELVLVNWKTTTQKTTTQGKQSKQQPEEKPEPAKGLVLTKTTTRRFDKIELTPPRFVEVPSRTGADIYSRLYVPEDVPLKLQPDSSAASHPETTASRPAVIFIHGAGYLQNAHKGWSGYFREFMFHSLLTRMGYVVLDMDYRASAGYGRDWRTAIYRQMGTPELEDLQDGVKWLAEHHDVDPNRVGVYGGSYGGFMTLMALFKDPDLFACGAALRPVTDWAHYNHGYTSNILNTPDQDPEAYLKSSPIYFADGLQRPLLICHGMVDDNVFFKDTVRLTQRLIELRKDNWNVAMYPVEPHGFRQPSSWFDEYRRIMQLFETHLKP